MMKRLPPPQLNLGSEPFQLVCETTQDGDKITAREQQREADQQASEKFQRTLQFQTNQTI